VRADIGALVTAYLISIPIADLSRYASPSALAALLGSRNLPRPSS